MTLDILLRHISKTGRDLWDRGWAEANGGNISLRLNAEQFPVANGMVPKTDHLPLAVPVPSLGGERFLVTGTGRYLRNIEVAPERNVGIIELNAAGDAYRILWGFEPEGRPTSELGAHLLSHAATKAATDNRNHAVIHTHAPNLITLTYVMPGLDTARLSTLLWKMHAECPVVFPHGVAFLPWAMAGSTELAEFTATALSKRELAVWEHHGIASVGRNLDEAFGRVYVAEKAAGIYLKALSAGGVRVCFTNDHVLRIARNFHCDLDASLLRADVPTILQG
jgi:rhamnulose-1-phosphate aldolase